MHLVGYVIRILCCNIKADRIWLAGRMLSPQLYSNIHCCSAIVCTHKSIYYWEVCLCLKELISEQLQPISTEYCKFYPTCNVKNNYDLFTFFYPIYVSLQRTILAYKYEIPYISVLNNVFFKSVFILRSAVLIFWKGFTYVHYMDRQIILP